jgi:hypothetical protein
MVNVTPRPHFTPRKDPVPIVQEAGWAPGPAWTGAENLAPTGIRSPDRPARSSVAIPTELSGPRYAKHIPYRTGHSEGVCFCSLYLLLILEQLWAGYLSRYSD